MQISVTLLLCLFILCCSGSLRSLGKRISVPIGRLAALFLLCAAVSGFNIRLFDWLSCNAASCILAVFALLLCRGRHETHIGILLAFLSGILSWFLLRLFPAFSEPGALLAITPMLLSLLFPLDLRQRLMCLTLSPMCYGLIATMEDWYLFDSAVFLLGNALQLSAQAFGLFLAAMIAHIPERKNKKSFDMQKEY